ncbi:hypothetical protein KFL_000220460 [Klebsormidium nitens]|uniref:Uncharacterized protein n=1 Tax=Klebsormidium nitens TaxID=105231 RepID=A0A1Y1HMS4_KLENI|nr:hypothetical protein KFL_000220460 [Klebsormidium nitens]|eukprot:GAQ79012.1 hypothetical protein KFL_000220460 [Klebsormidium nitens]
MAGRGTSRRFSVSGLLVDGDLIDLDQPAESMLLKGDGFLMDSDLDTEIFKASPPKPSVEAPMQVHKKDESPVETKTKRRRNKMRSSMAWDQAFQVDEDALFLRDPLDPPLAPEPPAPPRTTKRPTAIDVPTRKSFQDTEARPPLRARTPDPTPFAELQNNTPIPDAEPSPVQQQSGGKRRKEAVQESMAWNRAFQEENQGALLTDDLPLAESPVLPTRKKSPRKGMELQESSDSCTNSMSRSRQKVNRSSMAWDTAFRSGEGVLDIENVAQSSEARVARSSDQVSQSVYSSVESLNTEASTSSLAWTAPEDEAESGGGMGARLQSSLGGGLVGHVIEKTSTPVKHTPTKGERRRRLAGLHRPTSTAVAIETAIQHGTRLRLPGRYNPNPLPPPRSKPKTPEPASKPSNQSPRPEKSPKNKMSGSTSKESVQAKTVTDAVKKSLETEGEGSGTEKPGSSAGKPGSEQGMGPQELGLFEALQAQLAATQKERDALKAELEASTVERKSPRDERSQTPGEHINPDGGESVRTPGTERNDGTRAAAELAGPVEGHTASGLRRPQTRSTTGALPRGSIPQPAGSAHSRARGSLKDSGNGNGTVQTEETAPSALAPGVRPSFLKKPTAKRDFFQAPTTATLQSPAQKSAIGSAPVASPARHSRASGGAGTGAHSATEALKVPSLRRGATVGAADGASAKPSPVPATTKPALKPQSSDSSQSALPRYQSLLRKPSATGQSRTLKPGAFSTSAIQAACVVPLPSSPAGKLDVASPSPAKRLGARRLPGVSSPASSRLRRSADKPVTASSTGETARTPQNGADVTKTAPQGDPPIANAFLSKLAAASGGLSRIPSLGTSRLKPPGAKAPGVTSALPRPSVIDPALVAAACAAPLPGSPKHSNPVPLLPRGTSVAALKVTSALPRPSVIDSALVAAACAAPLPGSPKPSKSGPLRPRGTSEAPEAPPGATQSTSAGVSKLPMPPSRSLLRPPSSGAAALIRAACVVPLPLSPRNSKTPEPSPSPSEGFPKMDTTLKCPAGISTDREKAAKGSLSSSDDKRDAPPTEPEDTCPSSESSFAEPAPARDSPAGRDLVAKETIPKAPVPCSVNRTPRSPPTASERKANTPSEAPNSFSEASDEEPAGSVSFPSLQLPPDSCSHTRRFSKKPNLPTIYSPARGLFTPEAQEGDREGENRRPRSPVARALFASKLGKAARVHREVEDEGSAPAGVEDRIPVTLAGGVPATVEDGTPVTSIDESPAGAMGGMSDGSENRIVGEEAPVGPESGLPVCQAGGMENGTEDGLEESGFDKEGSRLERKKDEVQKELSGSEQSLGEETGVISDRFRSYSLGASEPSVIKPDQQPIEESPGDGTDSLAEAVIESQSYSKESEQPSVTPLAECSVTEPEPTEECPAEQTESLPEPGTEPQTYSGKTDQPSVPPMVKSPVENPEQVEQPGVIPSTTTVPALVAEAGSCDGEPAADSGQGLADQAVTVSVFCDREPAGSGHGLAEEAVTKTEPAVGAAFDQNAGATSGENGSRPTKLAAVNQQDSGVSNQRELSVSTEGGSTSAKEVQAVPVPELRAISVEAPESPTPETPSQGVASISERRSVQEASVVPDQGMPDVPTEQLPAVPSQESPISINQGAPDASSHEVPAVAEPEKPTARPEKPSEPEGIPPLGEATSGGTAGTERERIPPPEKAPVPAAVSGGNPGLFARMRARQAAVEALLDSPVKLQPSPVPKSIVAGRLECPVDIPGEQTKQPGDELEQAEGGAEKGTEDIVESGKKEEEQGVKRTVSGENEEEKDGEKQPGLEQEREDEQTGVRTGQKEEQPSGGPEEMEQLEAGEKGNEAGSQPGAGSPQDTDDSHDGERVMSEPDRAGRGKAEAEGADGGLQNEAVSSSVIETSLLDTDDSKCGLSAKDSRDMVTVLKAREEKAFSPVPSPGVKSPVSAAWEEAWFGTPLSKAGGNKPRTERGTEPAAGTGRACLTEETEQSPEEETEGKETGGKTQGTFDEDAASVSTDSSVGADVSIRNDDVCGGGDDVSSAVSAFGVDRAPVAQNADALLTEALSAGGFTPRASPARGGRGSGRKPSPKTPDPVLSLAIPPFVSPQTPVAEPRQTLESQFEDEAGKGEMDAQWDACVARFGGRKRTSPASLPRGPSGRRTPTRHSAEDLWSYLAPGRGGSPRLTQTRVASPVSVLTRTPGRLRNPLSESAPGLAGLMQSVMNASARKEEKPGAFGASSSPVARPRGMASARRKKPVLSPVNVSWDGDELDARIRAIEAAGEDALATKSGRVQASPPDKKEEAPANPYSPVKKKECGPFDCTKKSASF